MLIILILLNSEWAGVMVALSAIHEFVEHWDEHVDLLNAVEWIILPLANPDGYVKSHNGYRSWRKTVSTHATSDCVGADLVSNFEYAWGAGGESDVS